MQSRLKVKEFCHHRLHADLVIFFVTRKCHKCIKFMKIVNNNGESPHIHGTN